MFWSGDGFLTFACHVLHLWDEMNVKWLFPCSCSPSSSRQQEIEEKLIEEETARRVEELVAKRVEEELEKRKDEIEREVLRRVEEAKRIMERQLLEELERQRQAELAAQKAREVTLGRLERSPFIPPFLPPSPLTSLSWSPWVTRCDWWFFCWTYRDSGGGGAPTPPFFIYVSESNLAMVQASPQAH